MSTMEGKLVEAYHIQKGQNTKLQDPGAQQIAQETRYTLKWQ
jgi:hypothetical protein